MASFQTLGARKRQRAPANYDRKVKAVPRPVVYWNKAAQRATLGEYRYIGHVKGLTGIDANVASVLHVAAYGGSKRIRRAAVLALAKATATALDLPLGFAKAKVRELCQSIQSDATASDRALAADISRKRNEAERMGLVWPTDIGPKPKPLPTFVCKELSPWRNDLVE